MNTIAVNEALKAHIEMAGDLDLSKTNMISDERGLFIEGNLTQIISIAKAVVNIDDMTDESILNMYIMCVDFENKCISFVIKDE